MQTDIKGHSISPLAVTLLVFIIGLSAIIYSVLFSTWDIIAYICFSPFFLIILIQAFKNPFIGLCFLFTFNYFFILWYRYTLGTGLSVWYDTSTIILFVVFFSIFLPSRKSFMEIHKNILTLGGGIVGVMIPQPGSK